MTKPVFNPTQFELRNQLPVVVSDEQQTQIAQTVGRVNQQLDWVAQLLGWSGANYWDSLPQTVAEKRALPGGTFGIYNNYTLLRLFEVRTWEQRVITEVKPNIKVGQRVIIGDRQTFIYDIDKEGDRYSIDIGSLTDDIISLLEAGAAIKVDCPENRPFPFYRPEPLASGDADFRCSVGDLIRENDFYKYYNLVLSPYSFGGGVLPYVSPELYAGSYYYFDRAVYLSTDPITLISWVESEWIESKGLWQLYIHPEFVSNQCFLVWPYAGPGKKTIAYTAAVVIPWTDPSDWGYGGKSFNPVLDQYSIEKSYNIAGLNYGLGTGLWVGDSRPQSPNPLWFDPEANIVYAFLDGQWIECGKASAPISLSESEEPPPREYELTIGTIWQSPTGKTYVWGAPTQFIEPPLFELTSDFITFEGLFGYNTVENADGFYTLSPRPPSPDWLEIEFTNESLFSTVFNPAYASNLYLLVAGYEISNINETDNYKIEWEVRGDFLYVSYDALTPDGEFLVPSIAVGSRNGAFIGTIDLSSDFKARPTPITNVPYNEIGVLNNFLGAWGNKGGARSLDLVFDSLNIHGFNEQEALYLQPVDTKINFDELLELVTGKNIYVRDSPPPNAKVGDYYWSNETGALAVLYKDRDGSTFWIEINYPFSPCELGNPDCDYFPLKPILTTGSCILNSGDMWQDPVTPGAALFYESANYSSAWVEVNWNPSVYTDKGWEFSQSPNPLPDFSVISIFVTDELVRVPPDFEFTTEDFTFSYTILPDECAYQFNYVALSPTGIQNQPTIWAAPTEDRFIPIQITEQVFSNIRFYIGPAVQNAGVTLRPWRTQSLEVTDVTQLTDDTYLNPLLADKNMGPGDEDWSRSFIRLPSEYGRGNKQWAQSLLAVQDFTYAGTNGDLKEMRCPTGAIKPQIYDEVVFKRQDPSVGTVLYNEPYLYSDVEGFNNPDTYFNMASEGSGAFVFADFDYTVDYKYDEWDEAELQEFDPLHLRQVFDNGDWRGVYLEPTGNRPLTGFVERDLRVKSVIPVQAPIWDASIYKLPPLCPQGPESWVENPNNCKVGYAYFAADLAASEDGFFDQSQNVSWREPLEEGQTLYILNN